MFDWWVCWVAELAISIYIDYHVVVYSVLRTEPVRPPGLRRAGNRRTLASMDKLDLSKNDRWDNPYYNPKVFNLEILGEMEWDNESYQFNMTVVWKDAEGRLWTASDSGCSCPSPFEDTTELDRLWNLEQLEAIREEKKGRGWGMAEWESLEGRVKEALAALKEQG